MYAVLDILHGEYVPPYNTRKWVWSTEEGAKKFVSLHFLLSEIESYEVVVLDVIFNEVSHELVNG
jgi:hypothetical protein